ncbi:MAG: hypothetical protein JWO05_1299 [Gemmatimonadetes bacterium]|nr:hypothetical protein [Gemmatimonadota bacterium]
MTALRVSVVIPCYDSERYLGEAVESALGQRPAPHEVIVVDDGSGDDSATVARSFGRHVTVIDSAHRGASAARNLGAAAASGDAIAFLDADDVWLPGSLEARVTLSAGAGMNVIVAGLVEQFICPRVDEATRERLVCPSAPRRGRMAGSMLIPAGVFARVGPIDETLQLGEMIDWTSRADALGVETLYSDRVVLRRRLHDRNSTMQTGHLQRDYLRLLRSSVNRQRSPAQVVVRNAGQD